MMFRPCIDIHNGAVKQIVGGSLKDEGDTAKINFEAQQGADFFAEMYCRDGLKGGHIILLNSRDSSYYEATKEQAMAALKAYPGGMQVGGGITADNAKEYIDGGASHVIVTSYVFQDGEILWEHLKALVAAVGKERIVIDLSCRKKEDTYYIVTNRWQTFTSIPVDHTILDQLADYCDEFLIHGVDVEGKASGVAEELVTMLGEWEGLDSGISITYAGGIGSMKDLKNFEKLSRGKLDFTIGSALDLFGGRIKYTDIVTKKN